ncbi:hypothetical protein FRX31_020429 [Thalictrum thalictroides]|uniref:Protein FAR1-RELATED SEQUENCE n=1 Tax=Thalictrum thalictroides TaxID=46969 RepID=A0A7J6W0Y4_THATH|nr:hypothetical protein FRX31_020429 [Thalictrum thalictroides]
MLLTQVVFPNADKHLCRFHIATNVLRKGMDLLPTDKDIENLKLFWNYAVKSPTPEIFYKRFSRIEKMFRKEYYGLVCYLRNTWLIHKEMFVAAWNNHHLHFGCTTTNRVEGAHFQLKKDLGHTCQHDLLGMWSLIHPATNIQLREIRSSFEHSLVHTAHNHKIPLFKNLRSQVSKKALDLIYSEMKNMEKVAVDQSNCLHELRNAYGLPCAHKLLEYQSENCSIPLIAVNQFWRRLSFWPDKEPTNNIDCRPAISLYIERFELGSEDCKRFMNRRLLEIAEEASTWLEPPTGVYNPKGRPVGSVKTKDEEATNSSKRNPSAFEHSRAAHEEFQKEFQSPKTPMAPAKKRNTHAEGQNPSSLPKKSENSRTGVKWKLDFNDCPLLSLDDDFKRWIPKEMFQFVLGQRNPIGDENCGFRALCLSLGKTEDE